MEVEFGSTDFDRLETDLAYHKGWPAAVVRAYRKLLNYIRNAVDERDFYDMKSLHFEKLRGDRQHQSSMRLNDQYRLIIEFVPIGDKKRVRVVGIEDYH